MSLFRARPAVLERRHDPNAIPSNVEAGGYRNTSGHVVSTDTALRLAAVYGAVSIITDALATTPIDVYRKRSDGTRDELDTPRLLNMPSGTVEPVEWLGMFFASVLVRGNTYGLKDNFDSLGYPQEIHLVHPDDVTVQRTSVDDATPRYKFGGEPIPLRRVFHVKGFCLPGALEGLSPVANFAQTIGGGLAAEDFGSRFYGEGGHPTGVLQSDQQINQQQAEVLKARLMAAIRGRREPLVLGAGTKWQSIQVPPSESMFLDSLKFSALQIATMIFHIPASMLGIGVEGSSLTYSNREQDHILFQTLALLPWAVRFEQHLSRLLPGKQFVKFNMDAAVRVDLTTRYAAHAVGIAAKFLTVDEARQLEDRKPLTTAQKDELAPPPPPPPPSPNGEVPAEADARGGQRHGGHPNQKIHAGGKGTGAGAGGGGGGGGGGEGELDADQYEALAPQKKFRKGLREESQAKLQATPEGKVLSDALDDFQHGEGAKSMRAGITKEHNEHGSGGPKAQAMLGAVRGAPVSNTVVYRGMRVPDSHKALVAKYPEGGTMDMNLSSFSTSPGVANVFAEGAGRGGTPVIIGVVGKHQSLPIQNLAKNSSVFSEKEMLSGGKYKVLGVDKQGTQTVISVMQIETL